jgi:hypothetical protein
VLTFLSFVYNFNRQSKKVSPEELSLQKRTAYRYFREERNYEPDLIAFFKECPGEIYTCDGHVLYHLIQRGNSTADNESPRNGILSFYVPNKTPFTRSIIPNNNSKKMLARSAMRSGSFV